MSRSLLLLTVSAIWLTSLSKLTLCAPIDFNVQDCQDQFEAILRQDVDCVAQLRPGTLNEAPETLQTLISGMSCKIPIKFKKADVYNIWITEVGAKSPDFAVSCSLTGNAESDAFSASARVECTRAGPNWSCGPFLHDVNGLGFLGRALENYVNSNAEIRAALSKAINPADVGPH